MRRNAFSCFAALLLASGCAASRGTNDGGEDTAAGDGGQDLEAGDPDLGGDETGPDASADATVDATPLDADATPTDSDASPLDADATPLDADATPLDADATPLDADATPLDADATPLDAAPDFAGWTFGCVRSALLGDQLWPPQPTLSDASTLGVEVVREWTQMVDLTSVRVQELRYTSWEVEDCDVREVRIEAYYAIPTALIGGGSDPAVVVAHGLGGFATADSTANHAAHLELPVIYYSGPGNGLSEGRGSTEDSLFDAALDPRGSWFWSHAVAGARAITVLETRDGIDASHIGMTGYSAGSVATFNVNGFDDRLVATIPVSGVGGWDTATAAGGWQNALLEAAGLTADSPEYQAVLRNVDPINQAPTQHGAVLLINGAQDEFFPIDSTVRTFNAIPGDQKRILIIPNWDHGVFAIDLAFCGTFDNTDLAMERVDRATAWWFGHWLREHGTFSEIPPIPTGTIADLAGFLTAAGELSTGYDVVEAYIYLSNDNAWFFQGIELEDRSGDIWSRIDSFVPWATYNSGNSTWFVEFRLRVDLLGMQDFWVTSVPSLAPGLVPNIRPIDPTACLP